MMIQTFDEFLTKLEALNVPWQFDGAHERIRRKITAFSLICHCPVYEVVAANPAVQQHIGVVWNGQWTSNMLEELGLIKVDIARRVMCAADNIGNDLDPDRLDRHALLRACKLLEAQ